VRKSRTCAKCGGGDIVRIPGNVGPYGAGSNIPAGMTIFSRVKVARYVCGGCGYVEHYVEDAEGLRKLRRKYG